MAGAGLERSARLAGNCRSVATKKKQVWTRHVAVLQDASNTSLGQERHAETRRPAEQCQ